MENRPELPQWDDAPPPMIDEEEMHVLACELRQRANLAAAEVRSQTGETVASHAICLQ